MKKIFKYEENKGVLYNQKIIIIFKRGLRRYIYSTMNFFIVIEVESNYRNYVIIAVALICKYRSKKQEIQIFGLRIIETKMKIFFSGEITARFARGSSICNNRQINVRDRCVRRPPRSR